MVGFHRNCIEVRFEALKITIAVPYLLPADVSKGKRIVGTCYSCLWHSLQARLTLMLRFWTSNGGDGIFKSSSPQINPRDVESILMYSACTTCRPAELLIMWGAAILPKCRRFWWRRAKAYFFHPLLHMFLDQTILPCCSPVDEIILNI